MTPEAEFEGPRGDEPYWFEELRRDAAYEEWCTEEEVTPSEESEMPLNIRGQQAKEFRRVPEGVHQAVCNMVVDCGVQPGGKYPPRHQVYVRWEIPAQRVEWTSADGRVQRGPMNIGKFYTASLSEKAALRRDLENWRGRPFTAEELAGFDLFKILGTACQLMVAHTRNGDEIYANVTGVMSFPKNQPRPAAENQLVRYSPEEPEQFELLPRWLREKIENARRASDEAAFSQESAPLGGSESWRGADQEQLPFS